MWAIGNGEAVSGEMERRVFTSEDGAYAALGRLAVQHGAVGSMEVVELEVVGGTTAPARAEPARPEWLDETCPRPWAMFEDRDEDDRVRVHDRDGQGVFLVTAYRTTSDQDRGLAEYVAALVNAGRQ